MPRILGVICLVIVIAAAPAAGKKKPPAKKAHKHHDAYAMIKEKMKKDGKYKLHETKHGHMVHAVVFKKMVKTVSVSHKGNKTVTVSKFKSVKKVFALATDRDAGQLVLADAPGTQHILAEELQAKAGGSFVGFGFVDEVTDEMLIFWFPSTTVEGGTDDATDYDRME